MRPSLRAACIMNKSVQWPLLEDVCGPVSSESFGERGLQEGIIKGHGPTHNLPSMASRLIFLCIIKEL